MVAVGRGSGLGSQDLGRKLSVDGATELIHGVTAHLSDCDLVLAARLPSSSALTPLPTKPCIDQNTPLNVKDRDKDGEAVFLERDPGGVPAATWAWVSSRSARRPRHRPRSRRGDGRARDLARGSQ